MKRISLVLAVALLAVALAAASPSGASAFGNPPVITINYPAANSFAKTLPSLGFSVTGSAVQKTCSLIGPGGYYEFSDPCMSPYRPGEVTLDGVYTYSINAENPDGSDAKSVSFIVDQTAPSVTFTSAPIEGTLTNATIVAYNATYSDANLNAVTCRLDSATPTPCGSGGSIQQQYTNLTNGAHKLSISATDKAGNTGYAERNFTVDTIAPGAAIVLVGGDLVSNDNTPAFIVGGDDNNGPTTKKCRIENQIDWVDCNNSTWVTPDAIADGFVTAGIAVSDRAGNTSYASYGFTLDATIPAITVNGLANDRTDNTSPTLSFAVDDLNEDKARCGFDPADWDALVDCAEYAPQAPTAPLALGHHQFWVSATDTLGNVASAIYTFEVVAKGAEPVPTQPGPGTTDTPTLKLKARTGKVKRGRFTLAITASVSGAKSCERIRVMLAPKVKRAKTLKYDVAMTAAGSTCTASMKVRLSAKLKKKRAALTVTHGAASAKATIKL